MISCMLTVLPLEAAGTGTDVDVEDAPMPLVEDVDECVTPLLEGAEAILFNWCDCDRRCVLDALVDVVAVTAEGARDDTGRVQLDIGLSSSSSSEPDVALDKSDARRLRDR